ncbi:unnamed protein product, partial [Rotaria sordida]
MTNEILAWITDNETEFWTDHPHVSSLAYVKPISVMYLSTTSQDVQLDGTIIISYLKNWCHNYITNLQAKTNEMLEATQKMSSSLGKGNSIKEDALITPAPVYKQLLQGYAEEHAIQDL